MNTYTDSIHKKNPIKNSVVSFVVMFFLNYTAFSQVLTCPNNEIYSVSWQASSSAGKVLSMTVPAGITGTAVPSGVPGFVGALGVGSNLGFSAPNPTYWINVPSNFYHYYNGTTFVNSGHTTGNIAGESNLGCGGGILYNFNAKTGQVFSYNGTGNGSLLVTLPNTGTNTGDTCIFDIVCDDIGNFFILRTSIPQTLSMYGPNGVLKCTWNLLNVSSNGTNAGLAIINNTVYYTSQGIYAGNIIPGSSTITFTAQPPVSFPALDLGSCPIPLPTGSILAPNGNTLACNVPSLPLTAQIIPAGINYFPNTAPSPTLATCNYTWSGPGIVTGQYTPSITINSPGVYSYTTCAGICPSYSVTASFTVVSESSSSTPTITAPSCISSNTAILSVEPTTPTSTILWFGPGIVGGQGTTSITINTPGTYSVNINNGGCTEVTSTEVKPSPIALVSNSTSICIGEEVSLTASGGNTILWTPSTGLNVNNGPVVIASPVNSTNYTVNVSNGGVCTASTSVFIQVNLYPDVFAGRDTSFSSNQSMFINALGTGTLTWVRGEAIACPSCPLTQIFATQNGCYEVEAVSDFGCKSIDEMCIEITDEFGIFIPNSFTPNQDGINDEFHIYGNGISSLSLDIFDRWGTNIFSSNNLTNAWQGMCGSVPCEIGVYNYIVEYTGLDDRKRVRRGHITLTR